MAIGWVGKVGTFIDVARSGQIVQEVAAAVGSKVGESELNSWRESLPELAGALALEPALAGHTIVLECRMPGASTRADAVLLGTTVAGRNGAVVVELKQWDHAVGTFQERVALGDVSHLHPCAQARNYAAYLRLNHAAMAVADASDADREGESWSAVFAHEMRDVLALKRGSTVEDAIVNEALVAGTPVFGRGRAKELARELVARLPSPPNDPFVAAFAAGERRQSWRVGASLAEILEGTAHPWVLVGRQQEAALLIRSVVARLNEDPSRRIAVLITGGPGSGKTVLAMHAALESGRLQCVGTKGRTLISPAPSTNRTALQEQLRRLKKTPHAAVLSVEAPPRLEGIQQRFVGRKSFSGSDAAWREYCAGYAKGIEVPATPDFGTVIVDEAQALVDPSKRYVSGSQSNHWRDSWGPQAWHILNAARMPVFLMDAEQGYRQVESTTADDIRKLAAAEGIELVEFDLGTEQFRLAGLAKFVEWLDALFGMGPMPAAPSAGEALSLQGLLAFGTADAIRSSLRSKHRAGETSSRLLAGYAWKWMTKGASAQALTTSTADSRTGLVLKGRAPCDVDWSWVPADSDSQRDFMLGLNQFAQTEVLFGDEPGRGNRPALAAYALRARGQDFDHIGVFWGLDLVWRNGRWEGNPALDQVIGSSDMPSLRKAALNELSKGSFGAAGAEFARARAQAYRILLTRGLKSVQVWIEDEATRAYVQDAWQRYLASATA